MGLFNKRRKMSKAAKHSARVAEKEAADEILRKQEEKAEKEEAEVPLHAAKKESEEREKLKKDREEGEAYAESWMSKDTEGLTPQQKKNMESTSQRRLNKDIQGYQRQLVSKQGRNGIKGGAAYAQNADLARAGMEAKGQYQRDLSNLDTDIALKKKAAQFAASQGHVNQSQLSRQQASNEAKLDLEKKRERRRIDQNSQQFSRI